MDIIDEDEVYYMNTYRRFTMAQHDPAEDKKKKTKARKKTGKKK